MKFFGFGKDPEMEKQKELMEKLAEAFNGIGAITVRYDGRYRNKDNSTYIIIIQGMKGISPYLTLDTRIGKSSIHIVLAEDPNNQRSEEIWNRIFEKFPCPCGKGHLCEFHKEYFTQENIEDFPDINAITEYFCNLDMWFRKITESPKPGTAAAAFDIRIESARKTLSMLEDEANDAYFKQVDDLLAEQ